jgi:hypothetical protein
VGKKVCELRKDRTVVGLCERFHWPPDIDMKQYMIDESAHVSPHQAEILRLPDGTHKVTNTGTVVITVDNARLKTGDCVTLHNWARLCFGENVYMLFYKKPQAPAPPRALGSFSIDGFAPPREPGSFTVEARGRPRMRVVVRRAPRSPSSSSSSSSPSPVRGYYRRRQSPSPPPLRRDDVAFPLRLSLARSDSGRRTTAQSRGASTTTRTR